MRPSQTCPFAAWAAATILGLAVALSSSYLGAADQRGVFGLIIDEVKKGDVLAVLRPSDALLPVKDLEAAGLRGFAGKREQIAGREFVSLASLAPAITYQIDPKAVTISLTVQPSLLGSTTLDLRRVRPIKGLTYSREPSLFFNYDVNLTGLNQANVSGEFGLSLFGTSVLDTTLSRDPTGVFSRGSTNLAVDDAADLRRLVVGDTFAASTDALGGSASLGGFTLSRSFGLDPYLLQKPQGTFTGEVTTPSTVEVFVNGALVHRETLPPGAFTLQNIPYAQGAGTTRVVVRDAFGREQDFTSAYYLYTNVLRQGLSDYAITAGPTRQGGAGGLNLNYGKLVFDANGRYGLTDWFTPGVRVEGESGVLNGGANGAFSTPFGGLGLSAAISQGDLTQTPVVGPLGVPAPGTLAASKSVLGYAGSVTFAYPGTRFGLGAQLLYFSPHYANLGLQPGTDRTTLAGTINASYLLSERLTLTSQYLYSKDRDGGGVRQSVSINANARLTRKLVLFLGADYLVTSKITPSIRFLAGLSYLLGGASVLTGTYSVSEAGPKGSQGATYGLSLAKSPPVGPGFGYQLSTQSGQGVDQQLAQLMDHGNHGFYEFDYNRSGQQSSYTFDFSGSLVVMAGRLLPGPPVESAFALIRTPGLPGVEGYLFHQPAGRTDSNGDLLITRLVGPYAANHFGINEHDIPINYRIDATELIVAPPPRGGALVTFPVRPLRSFVGRLLVAIAGKSVIPKFGTLTMTAEGKSFASPIGRDGAFFLDTPPAGRHPAKIEFEEGTCSFTIDIPVGKEPFVRMGTLRCTM